ncbi:hypothetical protein BO99DRAFT_435755 [Aspergillus violaceofuscus CBS 115571]|uniref:Uncharacterized protein n=1 Tax=Aspergillus violaceofuscus (strain CBS 115571) TaxID=1450538 RepID=A0A2V5GX68_ASPV1|nr:hypothetical protein BO99DRAFT_435755 [Aspergillus violaceofuscus CBS 115571]
MVSREAGSGSSNNNDNRHHAGGVNKVRYFHCQTPGHIKIDYLRYHRYLFAMAEGRAPTEENRSRSCATQQQQQQQQQRGASKRAPAEVETEQFADESSDGELSELDSDQFDSEFKDDEVVDSETDSETDSENERPEEYDNEWEDIEEEITIRIPGNSVSQAAVSMPFRQLNANNAPRVKQITATGMLGSAAEWAAILCRVAEFWDTDLEVVWDPFLRQSFGPLSCALAFQFADAEKAHRMEHHIAATTKKAMEKMLTVSRWILMSSPDVVPMNPMRNMFIECLTG